MRRACLAGATFTALAALVVTGVPAASATDVGAGSESAWTQADEVLFEEIQSDWGVTREEAVARVERQAVERLAG
jgi:hypothetical protein